MAFSLKEFTLEELSTYNGKGEPSVYIANDGKVYDVSGSKFWKTGLHMKRHQSGSDLTGALTGAPHGREVFERVPQVGVLKPQKDPMDEHVPEILLALFRKIPMLRRHPHPMTVHFPLAFAMTVPLFNVLYMATKNPSFEFTAFSMLVLTLLATPVAMVTGPYAWWLNYGGRWTVNIKVKMSTSAVFLPLLIVELLWRISEPTIMFTANGYRVIYVSLSCTFPILVAILGWFGAKMTFPH
jgi:predicted heme/steroid binding protein/uncharacterized membrane protein